MIIGVPEKRDMIVVTGCNAVGKTSASYYLHNSIASKVKLPISRHIADSQILFDAMQQDDKQGGFHHTHDWCVNDRKGHSHEHGEPRFPFTVSDNKLPDEMRTRFFEKLVTLPKTGELWFVEWAAGMNTNTGSLSEIDYSYATASKVMEETGVTARLLERILAIVHIEVEMHIRSYLNRLRSLPLSSIQEVSRYGTAFWQKDETVLRFYGKDDFCNIVSRFEDIPIYHIKNDGTPCFFYEHLKSVAEKIQIK